MDKKPMEFSKIITIVILAIFILTWIIAWVVYILDKEINTDLLDYVSTPLMVIISGYFTKAGAENMIKIKEENTENIQ